MDFLKDKWINGKFYAWNETEYLEFDPELWEITPVSEKDILKINSCGLKRYYKNSEELNNKDWIILVFNIINECNLNCIYCYSKGSKFDPISDKAITTIAESYLKKYNKVYLSFTGGEPSLILENIKYAIKYLNNTGNCKFHLATNGTFNEEIRNIIVDNNFHVTVSMDGIPEINLIQRPPQKRNGDIRNDYFTRYIIENVKYLSKKGILFQIRSTLTDYSFNYFHKAIKFWSTIGVKFVHFELVDDLFLDQSQMSYNVPTIEQFSKNFFKIVDTAQREKIFLINSSIMNLLTNSEIFCTSLMGKRLHFNNDGSISSCYKAQSFNSKFREMIIGKFNINNGKIETLKNVNKRTFLSNKSCINCPIRYICSGGCNLRVSRDNQFSNICMIRRFLVNYAIKQIYYCSVNKMTSVLLGSAFFNIKVHEN